MRTRASLTLALSLLTTGCALDHTVDSTTTSETRIATTATSQASTTAEPIEPVTTAPPMTTTTVPQPGLIWVRVPHDGAIFGDSSYSQGMSGVAVGGPGLVAVGSWESEGDHGYPDVDAAVWTSVDGLTWARVPHDEAVFGGPGDQRMGAVVAGGPGLVAVGAESHSVGMEANAAVWTSVDGLAWARVPHNEAVFGGPDSQGMRAVAAGGPGLVAVGYDESGGDQDAAVWTSADGLTWARIPHDEAVFGGPRYQEMNGVVAGGPGLVAVGGESGGGWDAAVWTSADGSVWSRVPHDQAVLGGLQLASVAAAGPGLVAVGFDSYPDAAVIISADGLVWHRVPNDERVFGGSGWQQMYGVAAIESGVVAVGHDRSGENWDAVVWASADGLAWMWTPDYGGAFGGWYDQGISEVVAGGPGAIAVGYADGQGIYEETNAAVWVGSPAG